MKIRKDLIVIAITLMVLLGISSFYDYEISKMLLNRSSLVSKSVLIFAQLPTFILMTFFSAGIFTTRNHDGSDMSIVSAVVGFGSMAVFGFLCGYTLLYNMGFYSITLTFAAMVGICVCCYILSQLVGDHYPAILRKISKVGLLSFVSMIVIVGGARCAFERIPYRRLDGTFNIYAPWYKPTFKFDMLSFQLRSFPSVTAGFATMMYMVNLISSLSRRLKEKRIILMIITLSWTFIVGISEIILGRAYLSDVILSTIIGLLSIYIFYKIIYKEKKGS